jgi:hypothetical protein
MEALKDLKVGPAPEASREAHAEYEAAVRLGQEADCVPFLDELMYCYSPASQFSAWYYTGDVDTCELTRNNFFKCLGVKFNKSAAEKEAVLREINRKDDQSPTAAIWAFRKDPAKDWLRATSQPTAPPK